MRGYNFGAGPSMLPDDLLFDVQNELMNWNNTGMSILEIGHRTPEFETLLCDLTALMREVLYIPMNYQILWLAGYSRQHFSQIPMNFLARDKKAAHVVSGLWSKMAFDEAKRFRTIECVASNEASNFSKLPLFTEDVSSFDYLYYAPNETVHGVYVPLTSLPDNIPLVADMTSCLLTETLDIERYAVIFSGAQKTLSNAGLSVVIIRDDMLERTADELLPTIWDYREHAKAESLLATPPIFNCYLAFKMLTWIKEKGGMRYFEAMNREKSQLLYHYLDSNPFYRAFVTKEARSPLNICFNLTNPDLLPKFLNAAKEAGLYSLKGHKVLGGIRISIYNVMPMEGVTTLIKFMDAFAKEHQ